MGSEMCIRDRPRDGELAHRVLSNSAPPVLFFFTPVAAVDDSIHQPRVRVQFWVLIIFPSVTSFSALVLLVGFSSCPFFWSARLHALCWYFAPTYPPLV